LVFGGGFAIAQHIHAHQKPSLTPSQPGATINQVKAALLTSADLAGIDTNLKSADVQVTAPTSCTRRNAPVIPSAGVTRLFGDISNNLILVESIAAFKSSSDAHTYLVVSARYIGCRLTSASISDISSQLNGLCNESRAWEATFENNKFTYSAYLGAARCGRDVVAFQFQTPQGSTYDNVNNLLSGMELAVPKVEALP